MAANPVRGEARLQSPEDLLKKGRLTESELLYREIISNGSRQPLAHYGLGVIHFMRKSFDDAEHEMRNCLQLDPKHDNALYYLGLIFERRGESSQAPYYFRKALQANPNNLAAQRKLRGVSDGNMSPGASDKTPSGTAKEEVLPGPGLLQILRQDPSQLSRQTLALIDSIKREQHPIVSAYLGSFLWRLFFLISSLAGMVFVFNAPFYGPKERLVALIGALLWTLPTVVLILRIRSTTYSFDAGRLVITAGVIGQKTRNVELYRVVEFSVEQSFLNGLTRDGLLILQEDIGGQIHTLELRGVEKIDELQKFAKSLRELVVLLRGNTLIKGIVR